MHKDQVYEGEHDGIVDADLFERVQHKLDGHARRHRVAADHRVTKAPLTGKLFDAGGEIMSPAFSRGRAGRVYRYYVSASLQQGGAKTDDGIIRRLSAPAIEKIVLGAAERWLPHAKAASGQILAVHLGDGGLTIDLPGKFAADISSRLSEDERMLHSAAKLCRVHLPLALPLRGGQRLIIAGSKSDACPDPTLIAALRRAHAMLERDRSGMPDIQASPGSPYLRKLLRLAFLAPDIQRRIMDGHQPPQLNLQTLINMPLPLSWNEQRLALNWPDYN